MSGKLYSPKVVLPVHTHVGVVYLLNADGLVSDFTQFLVLEIIIINEMKLIQSGIEKLLGFRHSGKRLESIDETNLTIEIVPPFFSVLSDCLLV